MTFWQEHHVEDKVIGILEDVPYAAEEHHLGRPQTPTREDSKYDSVHMGVSSFVTIIVEPSPKKREPRRFPLGTSVCL
jgi:hypothetical protein